MSKIEERILERKRRKQRKKKIKRISISIVLFLILLISGGYYYFNHLYNTNSYVEFDDTNSQNENIVTDTEEPVEPQYTKVEGITNILLLGLDARNPKERSRSDSIMILTIDTIHNDIKLTSIMRDSYVRLYKKDEQKINSAYAYGGTSLLMDTIESNFNIDLDKYAIIDFNGFKELVNIVGGLEINIEEYMIDEMNLCIKELGDEDSEYITEAGLQHLDGDQVLGYSRMRNIKGGDYARTERQREVISLLMKEVQNVPKIKYFSVATQLLPYLKTNIELTQAFNLAYTVLAINNYDVQQLQIPVNELSTGLIHPKKGWLLIMDINQNAEILNDFIFEDVFYDSNNISYSKYKSYISKYYAEVDALEAAAVKKKEALLEDETASDDETTTTSSTNNPSTSNEETTDEEDVAPNEQDTEQKQEEENTDASVPKDNASEETSDENTSDNANDVHENNEDGQDTSSNNDISNSEESTSEVSIE